MDAQGKMETPLKVSMCGAIVERRPALVKRALAVLRIRPGTKGRMKSLSAVSPAVLLHFQTFWYRLALPTTGEGNQDNSVHLDPLKITSRKTRKALVCSRGSKATY